MPLNATPKSATANSYVTVAEADIYFSEERLNSEVWTSILVGDTTTKPRALIEATFLIDSAFTFVGTKRTVEQALRWPRVGAMSYDYEEFDYDEIPTLLKRATCELAIVLIGSDPFAGSTLDRELGRIVSEAVIGPLKVKFSEAQALSAIPERVRLLLASLGISNMGGGLTLSHIKTARS